MTDTDLDSAALPSRSFESRPPLADDLPPVKPPSAGFIVQLFIFPALIVLGVVAIWWMFGLIAVGEQDWRKLVQELQSQNLHVRNRAMFGLAQVLEQDSRRGEQGQQLRGNREIAQALADQLVLELRKNSTAKEAVAIQEYLTRALGMMDSIDAVAPALLVALEPHREEDIRKSALVSLAYIAGRADEVGKPLGDSQIVQTLIGTSSESTPIIRQTSTFTLGLFNSPAVTQQLEVLVENPDRFTAVNAAIGLARRGSTKGFKVFRDALTEPLAKNDAKQPAEQSSTRPTPSGESSSSASSTLNTDPFGDQFRVQKNVLKAVTDLATRFDNEQRETLMPLVQQLASQHPEIRIRVDAEGALNSLKAAASRN
ncbi:HEAT repeat domain-containing protein [Schlesneria sp. DSM 10557]|uniref:HEAT repeat domain-containing protein n=1 Tax=Schlesneria sp. DSM 10557 TaxID=3044399 RepID=UPI00359F5822